MAMFSLIAEQAQNRQDLFDDEGRILQGLIDNGCHLLEADAALTLMQSLVKKQMDAYFPSDAAISHGVRSMSREERDRFTVEAFGFASKLAHLGLITEDQREELLERCLSVFGGRIDIEHVKAIVAFLLFPHATEQEIMVPAFSRNIKRTAWN
jgi:uncharacterized protein Smg (DUF494 family)